MADSLPDDRLFEVWDVFTDTPFAGNPLAIVDEADGLSTAQMQTVAREFNLSETIFVMPPRDTGNTARVRIFTPGGEIPFAGHPTIGCTIWLASLDTGLGHEDFDRAMTLEEEAGPVPVTVTRRAGKVTARFRAPVTPHAATQGTLPEAALLARATGLAGTDLGPGPAGLWEGGPRFLYLPVASREALARARPQEPAWSEATAAASVLGIYVYTQEAPDHVRARMFAPGNGIPEDPATGSAAALLAAQLHAAGALAEGETTVAIDQGIEMGRPSRIELVATVEAGALKAVHVAGSAVPVSTGRIRIPD